jgi:hypothetical protein
MNAFTVFLPESNRGNMHLQHLNKCMRELLLFGFLSSGLGFVETAASRLLLRAS